MSNADLLRGLYEAFGRGEIETVLGAMDPAISWREAEGNPYKPDGQPWVGPDAVVQNLFARLGEDWDGFTVMPASYIDAGNRVVVEGRYSGTYRSTGQGIDAQFCHVWDVENGKLKAFQQYTDTGHFQDVMDAR